MSKKREDNSQFNYRPRPNNPNNVLGISFSHNPEQKELIRLMNEEGRPVIFCTGDAGTGKTFTALVAALGLVFDKKYRKIFYIVLLTHT